MTNFLPKKTILVFLCMSMLAVTYALVRVDSAQHTQQNDHSVKQGEYQITTQKSSNFVIALPSTPTAGYSWRITKIDDSFITLIDERYERFVPKESKESDFMGGSGTDYFEFRALKKGTTECVLHYGRPWEAEPIEVRVYHVVIE